MAKEVGCSHTTVSAAFSESRVPRWGLLELIVETLGGDTERFHRLWLAASRLEKAARAGQETPQITVPSTAMARTAAAVMYEPGPGPSRAAAAPTAAPAAPAAPPPLSPAIAAVVPRQLPEIGRAHV